MSRTILVIACMTLAGWTPPATAADDETVPILWRQTTPASATTEAMFIYRSPQFIVYRNGRIVFRDDALTLPYQQTQLDEDALRRFLASLEAAYHISAITSARLKAEEPYIKSVQKPVWTRDASTVTIWIGVRNPPSLHRQNVTILEARDHDPRLGPAWQALSRLNQYLAAFHHPDATPFVPDRVEIAVQHLPSRMAEKAASAASWPLSDVSLEAIKGERLRGYHRLSGEPARTVYRLVTENPVVREGDTVYLVWTRPLLLPEE